jgi:hypothetical protein
MALAIPPLKPVVYTLLRAGSWFSGLGTATAQLFNIWKPVHLVLNNKAEENETPE